MAGMLVWKSPAGKRTTRWLAVGASLGVAILIVSQITIAAPETFELIEHETGNTEEASTTTIAPTVDNIFESPLPGNQSGDQALLSSYLQVQMVSLLNPLIWLNCQTSGSTTDRPLAIEQKENAENIPKTRRIAKILTSISLDTSQWPLLGKPDAKYVIVEMLDYTCQHCQITDLAIRGAIDKYGDELAVIVLPVPMNASCNQFVKTTANQHLESCELAKLAIAVWRLEPKQFDDFHHWLFKTKPNYAAALKHANQITGENVLTRELKSKLPSEYVGKIVELYKLAGAGAIPKILFPNSTAVGEMSSAGPLISMIGREFNRSNEKATKVQ